MLSAFLAHHWVNPLQYCWVSLAWSGGCITQSSNSVHHLMVTFLFVRLLPDLSWFILTLPFFSFSRWCPEASKLTPIARRQSPKNRTLSDLLKLIINSKKYSVIHHTHCDLQVTSYMNLHTQSFIIFILIVIVTYMNSQLLSPMLHYIIYRQSVFFPTIIN